MNYSLYENISDEPETCQRALSSALGKSLRK